MPRSPRTRSAIRWCARAQLLIEAGVVDAAGVLARYDEIGWQVRTLAEEVIGEPKLATAAEVIAPLAPRRPARVAQTIEAAAARSRVRAGARASAFGGRLPEHAGPLTLAQAINATLTDALLAWPQAILFGEDVAAKGGVYGVTKGLRDRFGADRVFDTLLDETSILGLALGAGLAGVLPIPEIQYLAYLHTAEDQLRGEAATMQFFSAARTGIRWSSGWPGWRTSRGSAAISTTTTRSACCGTYPDWLSRVPAARTTPRPCCARASPRRSSDGSVCAFLEPIALYHTRDLSRTATEAGSRTTRHRPTGRRRTRRSGAPGSTWSAPATI